MLVTESGIITDVSFNCPKNASRPILITLPPLYLEGMTISLSLPEYPSTRQVLLPRSVNVNSLAGVAAIAPHSHLPSVS